MTSNLPNKKFDAIILAVAHNEFKFIEIEKLKKSKINSIRCKRIFRKWYT